MRRGSRRLPDERGHAAGFFTPDILRVIEHHTKERSHFEVWAKALFEYARDLL